MARNPSEVARKWQRNMASSSDSVKSGVQAVTRNPAEAAAANEAGYLSGVQRSVANGKWKRGLSKVTLGSWQDAMITKGITRMAAGAQAAVPKVENFMAQWLPHMDALKQKLQNMPRGDIEQNKQRMLAAVDHAANFRRS